MKHVYIVQCGIDVVCCSSSISYAYRYLAKRLAHDEVYLLKSYMSVTRHFNKHSSYFVALPNSLTWWIKKLPVQRLLKNS